MFVVLYQEGRAVKPLTDGEDCKILVFETQGEAEAYAEKAGLARPQVLELTVFDFDKQWETVQ